MSSAYEVKVMSIQEFAHDISTKCERDSTIILTPALDVLVRIRPQKITQETYKSTHDTHTQLSAIFQVNLHQPVAL